MAIANFETINQCCPLIMFIGESKVYEFVMEEADPDLSKRWVVIQAPQSMMINFKNDI